MTYSLETEDIHDFDQSVIRAAIYKCDDRADVQRAKEHDRTLRSGRTIYYSFSVDFILWRTWVLVAIGECNISDMTRVHARKARP